VFAILTLCIASLALLSSICMTTPYDVYPRFNNGELTSLNLTDPLLAGFGLSSWLDYTDLSNVTSDSSTLMYANVKGLHYLPISTNTKVDVVLDLSAWNEPTDEPTDEHVQCCTGVCILFCAFLSLLLPARAGRVTRVEAPEQEEAEEHVEALEQVDEPTVRLVIYSDPYYRSAQYNHIGEANFHFTELPDSAKLVRAAETWLEGQNKSNIDISDLAGVVADYQPIVIESHSVGCCIHYSDWFSSVDMHMRVYVHGEYKERFKFEWHVKEHAAICGTIDLFKRQVNIVLHMQWCETSDMTLKKKGYPCYLRCTEARLELQRF
jgi:hypothetical protein